MSDGALPTDICTLGLPLATSQATTGNVGSCAYLTCKWSERSRGEAEAKRCPCRLNELWSEASAVLTGRVLLGFDEDVTSLHDP